MLELKTKSVEVLALQEQSKGERLIRAFLSGKKATTLAKYKQSLIDFSAFIGRTTLYEAGDYLVNLTHGEANEVALAYREALIERGLTHGTINNRLIALRMLIKTANVIGRINWSLDVSALQRETYRDTKGPGLAGFTQILNAVTRPDAKGIRDRAILRLFFDCAMRCSELTGLDLEHVDVGAGTISILGKGREQRELITVPAPTWAAIGAWLAWRGNEPGPLFYALDLGADYRAYQPGGHRLRLSHTGIYTIIRKLGRAVGIKVRPHGLRHASITQALDSTKGNIRAVQRFARLRTIETINFYDDNRSDLAGEVAGKVASSVHQTKSVD
jgi:integrase/recombinase XerC